MDTYARAAVQKSVARMLLESGFTEVEQSALDWLVDLSCASLERAGQFAKKYAEHSRRSLVFRYDAERALSALHEPIIRESRLKLKNEADAPATAANGVEGPNGDVDMENAEAAPKSVPKFLQPMPSINKSFEISTKLQPIPMSKQDFSEDRFQVSKALKAVNIAIGKLPITRQVLNHIEEKQAKPDLITRPVRPMPGQVLSTWWECKPRARSEQEMSVEEDLYFGNRGCWFRKKRKPKAAQPQPHGRGLAKGTRLKLKLGRLKPRATGSEVDQEKYFALRRLTITIIISYFDSDLQMANIFSAFCSR